MRVKDIIYISLFVAVLIVLQVALSSINGIELVTVVLASIAFAYGLKVSIITANVFIVLRSFIFGIFPSIMVLYFVYYNLFVLCFWLIGRKAKRELSVRSYIISIVMSVVMTILFTLLDNVITPLWYSFDWNATKAYWLFSLTAVIPQVICTIATMVILFPILIRVYTKTRGVNNEKRNRLI